MKIRQISASLKILYFIAVLSFSNVFLGANTVYTWTVAGSGDWNDHNHWDPTVVPNSLDAQVVFSNNVSATINLTGGLGIWELNVLDLSAGSYTFGPHISEGLLFLTNSDSDPPYLQVSGGTHTINSTLDLPSSLGSPFEFLVTNSESVLTILGQALYTGPGNGPGISLSGPGTLVLHQDIVDPLRYNDNYIINQGTLQAWSSEGLGDTPGIVSINDSTFQAGTSFTSAAGRSFSLAVSAAFDTNGNNLTINGIISDDGTSGLTKIGSGILKLSGVNIYTGPTLVSVGTLQAGSATSGANGAFGDNSDVTIASSATLDLNGFDNTIGSLSGVAGSSVTLGAGTATLTISDGNSQTFSGIISGSGGGLTLNGGTLTLGGVNIYTGSTTVSASTLQAGAATSANNGAFGNNTDVTITGSGTLALNGYSNTIGSLTAAGGNFVTLGSGSATLTISDGSSNNVGAIISGSGGGLTLSSGILILSGLNTYTGATIVNGGTLRAGVATTSNNGAFGNSTAVTVANSATLSLNGNNNTIGSLSGDLGSFATLGVAALTTGGNNNSTIFAGIISGVGGSLIKTGSGTFTITGVNTYTGGTMVNAGTLQGNTTSLQGSFTIAANAILKFDQTTLGTYAGTITGAGSLVKSSAGTLILGTPGTYNYSGGTTVRAGILQGTTATLQGNISILSNATLMFAQGGSSGTYSGNLTGVGTLVAQGTSIATILTLSGNNSLFSGPITIDPITLQISSVNALGTGHVSMTNSVLQAGIAFSASNTFTLNASETVDTQGFTITLSGAIGGGGSLTKQGSGTLILLGNNNSYAGPTNVAVGTLQGNTSSLQGAMNLSAGATLTFSQNGSGTFSGVITGPANASLSIQGGGLVSMTGNSSGFLGTTTLSGNGQLAANGNLSSSPIQINAGSILSGTGTVGSIGGTTNTGQIIPGASGGGTLSVNGTLSFDSGGELVTQITPSGNNLLAVSGLATLTNGTSVIEMSPGFYGISGTRIILTAGSITSPFATLNLSPRIEGHLVYNSTFVQLVFNVLDPFFDFPFANANERAVGNNLDTLLLGHLASSDLISAIDAMAGLSIAEINDALDQMHPAAMSAFAELQTELGGQLLSLFHRRPMLACMCTNEARLWIEPFGNWLDEKKQGMEIGFNATTRGVAFGFDYQFYHCWTLGIGGAYNATDLHWSLDRGYAYVKGAYGSLYSDLFLGNFYLGVSAYAGKDWYDTMRQIHYSTIDRQAKSNPDGIDAGGQITAAYFFGAPACLLYPYATVDFLYLENSSFKESGAMSLDLDVDSYSSSTLRAEAGGALRFVDRNRDETICISPLISMGYVLELPLHRDHYRSTFSGMSIPFTTQGWDMAWQLLNLRFGLGITYRCFTLDSDYSADISPEGDSPFFNQRANFRISCNF